MGVSYYSCDCCNEALYSEYVACCESCGASLCADCLVGTEDIQGDGRFTYPYSNEDGEIKAEYCPYCQGIEIDDGALIHFLLNKLGMTLDQAKEEFLKSKMI